MANAAARGWGDIGAPGSAAGRRFRREKIVKVDVGGIRLWVHHEVATIFTVFIAELVRHGYPVADRADDWGYIHRYIAGTRTLSNHSWGLAVDLNAITNPMTSDWKVHTDMPAWVQIVAFRCGLSWGGLWSGRRKDPMHFEFLETPHVARVITARLTLLAPDPSKPPKEEPDMATPLTIEHPVAGFSVIFGDGSVHNYADNRSPKKAGKRVPPPYIGGMNLPHMLKFRRHAPGVAPSGGYYVPDKKGHALVITYPDGGYFQFPSDGSLTKP